MPFLMNILGALIITFFALINGIFFAAWLVFLIFRKRIRITFKTSTIMIILFSILFFIASWGILSLGEGLALLEIILGGIPRIFTYFFIIVSAICLFIDFRRRKIYEEDLEISTSVWKEPISSPINIFATILLLGIIVYWVYGWIYLLIIPYTEVNYNLVGIGEDYGPYQGGVKDFSIVDNRWAFYYLCEENICVMVDGKKFEYDLDFSDVDNLYLSETDWMLKYSVIKEYEFEGFILNNETYFIIINNQTKGPYDVDNYWELNLENWDGNLEIINGNVYNDSNQSYFLDQSYNIMGENYSIQEIRENAPSSFMKVVSYKEGMKYEVDYGPFDYVCCFISDKKWWGFEFWRDGERFFNINDKEYGPFERYSLTTLVFTEDHFIFRYTKANKQFLNIDGVIYGPIGESTPFTDISASNDLWGITYFDDKKWFVKISNFDLV